MTMDRSYGSDVLAGLASLVATTRVACGLTAWDIAGIRDALRRAASRPGTTTIGQLAHAALTIACDETARTPGLIPADGPHWNASGLAPVVQLYRRPTGLDCATCHLNETDCRARHPGNGHPYNPKPEPPAPPPTRLTSITNPKDTP